MLKSQTLVALIVLAVVLLAACVIALRGENSPAVQSNEPIPITVDGKMPERGKANEAFVTPKQEKPVSPDPVPPLPDTAR